MTNHSDIPREVLPIPDRKPVSLTTYDANDPDTKFPPILPLRPPAGAPNVLIILLDDVGFLCQDAPAPAAVAQPAAAPAPDFLHQEQLTGDWNGARTPWKNKGVELASSLTQFYQGVSSGGTGTSSEYNGTAQALLKFDLGKLAGWQFWSAEIKAETRFGGPLVTSTGTISPVNTAAIIPAADGTVFSVTAVNFTKLFPVNLKEGTLFAVSFGRYNLVDLLDEDFFAGAGQSDSSISRKSGL
jgi:hypothetical protein